MFTTFNDVKSKCIDKASTRTASDFDVLFQPNTPFIHTKAPSNAI